MIHPEYQYLNLLKLLIKNDDEREDRTGVGTRAIFGYEMRFNLEDGFPVFTTKRVFWKTAFKEMLWMLSGGTNIRELLEQNVRIWTAWPLEKYRQKRAKICLRMNLKNVFWQIRCSQNVGEIWDQFMASSGDAGSHVMGEKLIKFNSSSIRSEMNHTDDGFSGMDGTSGKLGRWHLPPCHKHYQFFVKPKDGKLCGALIQRSADSFLGLSWNVANLALVTTLLAKQTNLQPGEIIWYGLDVHLYLNHISQAK